MEALATLFASINYRDPVWIAVAYLFGFIVWQKGLPLVGFLVTFCEFHLANVGLMKLYTPFS